MGRLGRRGSPLGAPSLCPCVLQRRRARSRIAASGGGGELAAWPHRRLPSSWSISCVFICALRRTLRAASSAKSSQRTSQCSRSCARAKAAMPTARRPETEFEGRHCHRHSWSRSPPPRCRRRPLLPWPFPAVAHVVQQRLDGHVERHAKLVGRDALGRLEASSKDRLAPPSPWRRAAPAPPCSRAW